MDALGRPSCYSGIGYHVVRSKVILFQTLQFTCTTLLWHITWQLMVKWQPNLGHRCTRGNIMLWCCRSSHGEVKGHLRSNIKVYLQDFAISNLVRDVLGETFVLFSHGWARHNLAIGLFKAIYFGHSPVTQFYSDAEISGGLWTFV